MESQEQSDFQQHFNHLMGIALRGLRDGYSEAAIIKYLLDQNVEADLSVYVVQRSQQVIMQWQEEARQQAVIQQPSHPQQRDTSTTPSFQSSRNNMQGSPPGTAAVQAKPRARVLSRNAKWFYSLGAVAALIVGFIIYGNYEDSNNYILGHQAYRQADCSVAIERYDRVLSAWRLYRAEYFGLAQREKNECNPFAAATSKQQDGDIPAAMIAYRNFIRSFKNSPLASVARERIGTQFIQAHTTTLAHEELCLAIDGFIDDDLIPTQEVVLPSLYPSCGEEFENHSDYAHAVQMYEKFLAEYREHEWAPAVEEALARSIVAKTTESEAGELPAPPRSGDAPEGSTVVSIQNDSPESMRITFSGPEARVEELAACTSCKTFTGVGPMGCPNKGPSGVYTLQPGEYDVVVESVSDGDVTPFKGTWQLSNGAEYAHCFYIVTSFGS